MAKKSPWCSSQPALPYLYSPSQLHIERCYSQPAAHLCLQRSAPLWRFWPRSQNQWALQKDWQFRRSEAEKAGCWRQTQNISRDVGTLQAVPSEASANARSFRQILNSFRNRSLFKTSTQCLSWTVLAGSAAFSLPGLTTTTWIPKGLSSMRKVSDIASMACFVAPAGIRSGWGKPNLVVSEKLGGITRSSSARPCKLKLIGINCTLYGVSRQFEMLEE